MRILIVGGGGREHALAWALSQSPVRPQLFIAPGNAGTLEVGENVPIAADDLDELLRFARENEIDLTVVGPELPLVNGIVDRFEEAALPIVGPTAAAARLEGSKAFAKAFMERHRIPTASYRRFARGEEAEAHRYLSLADAPIVVKASGLAAGKGAIVCETLADAHEALDELFSGEAFGDAASEVVIEEYMDGEEASVFALADGEDYVLLAPAQDHKRVGEGDSGPNTGGMGAYAPAPLVTEEVMDRVRRQVIEPTLRGMAAEGNPYRGFLYAGLMILNGEPRVVKFNCRLGDPEAQVVLPLLNTDLVDLLHRQATHRLAGASVPSAQSAAVCVVLASEGYPGSYPKGRPITGLRRAGSMDDVHVFHAGTTKHDDGSVVTTGGRVLGVTATGDDLRSALNAVYAAVECLDFEGCHYRRDIGQKGLLRLANSTS